MLLATAFLTTLAFVIIGGGGVAGWWGAYVAMRSDRRLQAFLDGQVAAARDAVEVDDGDD